jgi:hypothetical protein
MDVWSTGGGTMLVVTNRKVNDSNFTNGVGDENGFAGVVDGAQREDG